MSAREVISELWQAGREDAREATVGQKALLGAAALGLVAEWTATEASLIAVSDAVLEATHNPTITALATGGTSFVEQAALGLLTVASIRNFPGTFAAVRTNKEQRRQRKANEQAADTSAFEPSTEITAPPPTDPEAVPEGVKPTERKHPSFLRRFGHGFGDFGHAFGDAFGLGTSLNALIKNSNQEYSDSENAKNVISDATLIGLGVTAVFEIGTEAFSEQTATDILTSPWTYAAVLTYVVGSRVVENIRPPKEAA